ncbi:putative HC-toxin efflux carrier TOXA [Cladophialophora carrionii]|uniref:Putative HC-toxin efflux carrier TOXA n=1 Tax=Cladophialophora carrionii TaxID=86049 RepID=A0A1C1CND1_9EURO|nr:putative HC-toxin efflux carrier TOXA [Cladophialophora carrionii]
MGVEEPTGTTMQEQQIQHQQVSAKSSDESPTLEKQHGIAIDSAFEGREWPGPAQVAAVMIAICLSVFLVALDRTIIATAIPKITDQFHSLDDVGWYGSGFLLTSCALLLPVGRLMTFYSPKWVFLTILVIFEIGSVVCGAAPNSDAFIIGRAIAGIGGAGIMTGGTVLLTYTIPLAKRPKFQGFIGISFGLASVAGPFLGGAFTSNVTWRWCFYINLPVGAVSIIFITFILKSTPPPGKKDVSFLQHFFQLDPLGTLFLIPSLVCLVLALQYGGTVDSWSSGRVIALLVVFAILAVGFILVQIFNKKNSMVPHGVIKNRDILSGALYMFCHGGALTTLVIYVPLYFQAIKGVSAVKSGVDTFPMILALVLGIIMGGVLTGKIGYYAPMGYVCVVLAPIGCGLIATWTRTTNHSRWIGYQVIAGYGLGIGFQSPMTAAQTVLADSLVPLGVACIQFAQVMGATVFVAVAQNLLTTRLTSGLAKILPNFDPNVLANTGAVELRDLVPAAQLDQVLEIYMHALRQVFFLCAGLAAAIIIGAAGLSWKSVKVEKQEPKKQEEGSEKSKDEEAHSGEE